MTKKINVLTDSFLGVLIAARDSFDELKKITYPLKISEFKTLLDFLFRKVLIHEAFLEKNVYVCPLTGEIITVKEAHVCHYIDRSCLNLRWDKDNCIICSSNSNCVDSYIPVEGSRSKHHHDFEKFIGEEKVVRLQELYTSLIGFSRYDYVLKLEELLLMLPK